MTDKVERKVSLNRDIVAITPEEVPNLASRTDILNSTQVSGITRILTSGKMKQVKMVPISRWNFESDNKNSCAVCLTNHTHGECIRTVCGHTFGIECWAEWITRRNSPLSCPVCRKSKPSIRGFCMKPDGRPALTRKEAHKSWKNIANAAIIAAARDSSCLWSREAT